MIHLDAHQRHVVDLPLHTSVLLTGEAGTGKTTAALHRLARCAREDRGTLVVPTPELAAAARTRLRGLGVLASVTTLDGWLGRVARHAFRGLAERDSEEATAGVIRLKRHPAVRTALPDVAELSDEPIGRDDLLELWGDTSLLLDVVDASEGALREADAHQVGAHAAVQFAELDRNADGSVVLGMCGIPIHEGTPLHDATTCDVEDVPILFALDRLRGGRAAPKPISHLLLDEAQELAPMELELLGRALGRGGSVTVIGDERQQVDPTAWFAGWEAALGELGVRGAERVHLTTSHRCPPAVLRAARALLEGEVPLPGAGVERATSASRAEHVAALARWVAGGAGVTAIVAADPEGARELHAELPRSLGAQLAVAGVPPVAGRFVTDPRRLHGLEVERVAVDLGRAWPQTGTGRRALYVAVTRARQQVWLGAVRGADR